MATAIEWTSETVGLWVGCNNPPDKLGKCQEFCYAQGQTRRFEGMHYADRDHLEFGPARARAGLTFVPADHLGVSIGKGPRWTGRVWAFPSAFVAPLTWREPRLVFPNSQSDFFHEAMVSDDLGRRVIAAAFGLMAVTEQHRWQVLTKRPGPHGARAFFKWLHRVAAGRDPVLDVCIVELISLLRRADAPARVFEKVGRYAERRRVDRHRAWPLPNVLIGTSVEAAAATPRVSRLRGVEAAHRFLSLEPLLEDLGELDLSGIDWVIDGGASGPKAMPMHPAWARSIRDQCKAAGVPYFHKQNGEYSETDGDDWTFAVCPIRGAQSRSKVESSLAESSRGRDKALANLRSAGCVFVRKVGKKAAGRELDGVIHDEMPEVLRVR